MARTNSLRINRQQQIPRTSPNVVPFVLTMRPDLVPAYAALVGPFQNTDEAIAWGKRWQAAAGDCPCWQLLELGSDYVVRRVNPLDVVMP